MRFILLISLFFYNKGLILNNNEEFSYPILPVTIPLKRSKPFNLGLVQMRYICLLAAVTSAYLLLTSSVDALPSWADGVTRQSIQKDSFELLP